MKYQITYSVNNAKGRRVRVGRFTTDGDNIADALATAGEAVSELTSEQLEAMTRVQIDLRGESESVTFTFPGEGSDDDDADGAADAGTGKGSRGRGGRAKK